MKSKKNVPEQSGIAFMMQESQAELSLASLFYFQNKMSDQTLKVQFEKNLLDNLAEHAATAVHHNTGHYKVADYVPMHERAENYAEKDNECRLSWILTYAAKLICEEGAQGEANPFKKYYTQYLPYIFDDMQQAASFQNKKPKLITVVPDDEQPFSFSKLFRPKAPVDACKAKVAQKVTDFLYQDPFIDAIDHVFQSTCLTKLQENIDDFVVKVEPALENYWKAKGLQAPFPLALKAA